MHIQVFTQRFITTLRQSSQVSQHCVRSFAIFRYIQNSVVPFHLDFHQGRQHLRTFVEDNEADTCLEEDRCLSLGLQIGQLRTNFEKYIHEHALEDIH